MLNRSPISALQSSFDQDESESLQADVMRFMAILGLCLMVIFALVQSLPTVGESREAVRAREANSAALNVEISELRNQLSVLSAQNREANSQLQQYEQTVQFLNEQALAAQAVNASLAELREQRDRLEAEQLRHEEQLNELQEKVQVQSSELAAMRAKIDTTTDVTQPIVEYSALISTEAPEETITVNETQPFEVEAEVEEEVEGFRLKFASNEAFFQLVKSAEISVFVISPDKAGFRLDGNAQQLLPASLPSSFQDIDKASLPASLLTTLSRQRLSSESRWGVVLSDRVLQSIHQAQENARGGILSIDGFGDVRLQ